MASTISSRTLVGNTLTLTYNERLRESSVPATGRFTVTAGGTAQTVRSVAVSDKAVILTLASAVAPGTTVTMGYTQSGTKIEDLAGNDAANFSSQSVSNPDRGPRFVSATVNSSTLVITLDEALDTAHVPATNWISIIPTAGGGAITARSITLAGSTVTATLRQSVPADAPPFSVNCNNFSIPANQRLQDAAGNHVPSFIEPVTNELVDLVPPTDANGTASGRTISLTFDKALKAAAWSAQTTTLRYAFMLGRRGHEDQHPPPRRWRSAAGR